MSNWFFKPNNLLFAMHVGMTREVSLHVKGYMLTNDSILTRTSDVVLLRSRSAWSHVSSPSRPQVGGGGWRAGNA